MTIAVMVMSHGNFAQAALESAELIIGKQGNTASLSIFAADNIEHLKQELSRKIAQLDTKNGLILLTDILGGTPMNLASQYLTHDKVLVCCGLNLPLLLDVLMNRDEGFGVMHELIQNAYRNGFTVRTVSDVTVQESQLPPWNL